ncbi:MAG: hypothetical protein M3Q49_07275 [Actinomycetota bacterium]|nr:hypothetical protein [Actinomycetota bacterium]MDP9485577.1 hypothetical protein [Actinomycetota bacterium]
MSTKPTRVAIYLGVSKDDGSQETDNQLIQLRDFCERWQVHESVGKYVGRRVGHEGLPRAQGLRPDVRRRRSPSVRRLALLGAG